MDMAVQIFIVLLLAGLILFGAEIFAPGAVLGVIGAACLLGAIIAGFIAFPGMGGYVAIGIVFLLGIAIVLWITVFPKSAIGRRMTVFKDLAASAPPESASDSLLNTEGEVISELRPAGYAMFGNRRVDVLTRGEMIAKGAKVKVIRIEGSHVFVAKV